MFISMNLMKEYEGEKIIYSCIILSSLVKLFFVDLP